MANTTRRDRRSKSSSSSDDLDLERLFRLRNVFTIALVLTALTMMLSGPLNVVSHYQQMLRNRLLYPEMASADDATPDAETILKNLKADPQSSTAPPLDVDPYTLENVVRSMDIYKDNFSIVVYDPEEDNFLALYNKKHPWLRSNAKLMGSFKVLASSLRLMFPERFRPGTSQPEFAVAIGSGDLPSTKKSMCVERHDEAPCIGDDASPILQFGSVYRGSFFPSMIPMPNPQGNHLQCYHHWARWTAEGKRDVVCNFYLPRSPSVPNGLVFGETVGLSWDDLIPQVIWRGTDFRYYIHNVRKNLRPAYLDDFEKRRVETTDEAIRALREIYDELLPRWRGVVWTTEAEYEAELLSDGNKKVIPWANIKFADGFEDGKKTPSAEVKKFQKLGDLGVSAAGESMPLEELAKYKYHIDIGGGGGTTWSGTLEKLALPGLLFHHVTL
mmetsp:Transcript_28707/g.58554  ORF Transcript_28707/g.58554 Transcript_28707/m.58554 type:complete len:443 (-) Transcript_28707:605-1933(-)